MPLFSAALPEYLDPIFSYLADVLPYPIYSILITLVSHCLALAATLFTLLSTLASTHPREWNAQIVLPPLFTVVAAYLSLLAVYRTTAWVFRTVIWFMKWGIILTALAAGAGWFAGHSVREVGEYGVVFSKLGDSVIDAMNQHAERSQSRRNNAQSQEGRPRAWESFYHQRERQQKQNRAARTQNPDAQELMDDIVTVAQQVIDGSGWGAIAETMSRVSGFSPENNRRGQPARDARTGSSQSRQIIENLRQSLECKVL